MGVSNAQGWRDRTFLHRGGHWTRGGGYIIIDTAGNFMNAFILYTGNFSMASDDAEDGPWTKFFSSSSALAKVCHC